VLPRRLTPNQITVAGQLAALTGFLVVATGQPVGAAALLVLAATIVFYTLADCVDGLFARHTRQTSRLGELLDHWLDAVSVPLGVLSFGLALPAAPGPVLAGVVTVSFLHFATFLHGFRLGWVHLGKIGVIEGNLLGAAICVTVAVTGPGLLARTVVGEWNGGSLLLLAMVLGASTALWSMRGLWRHRGEFVTLGALFAALAAWFAWGRLGLVPAALAVIGVGSYLEGKVIRARLLRLPLVLHDHILLALVLLAVGASLAFDLPAAQQTLLAALVATYAFARGGTAFARTVAALRGPPPGTGGSGR
jgi:phosphatidylglycerophosphate synthase